MKTSSVVLFLLLFSSVINAQTPQGMNYQAVARNLQGQILANEDIELKINLYSIKAGFSKVYYSELHYITTNQIGLFSLVIGDGKSDSASFDRIPWSSEQIWMEVSIKDRSQALFSLISSSKLLTVPYAFHAGTASKLSELALQNTNDTLPKLIPGNNVSVSGIGTTVNPYIINAFDTSSSASIIAGSNMTISGTGSNANPYIINTKDSIKTSSLEEVLAAGNTATNQILKFNQQPLGSTNSQNFLEINPDTYNPALKRGNIAFNVSSHFGVNSDARPNTVFAFGYNNNGGGGSAIAGEASWRMGFESHYLLSGEPAFEFHFPDMIRNDGYNLRPFSMYIKKATGLGSLDMQMEQINANTVNRIANNNTEIHNYFNVNYQAKNARMDLKAFTGGAAVFSMEGAQAGFNRFMLMNDGGQTSFTNSGGGYFTFNNRVRIGQGGTVAGLSVYGGADVFNPGTDANSIALTVMGMSSNNYLFKLGDELNNELIKISRYGIYNTLPMYNFNNAEFVYGVKLSAQAGPDTRMLTVDAAGNVGNQAIPLATTFRIGANVNSTNIIDPSKYVETVINGVTYKLALVQTP